MSAGSGITPNAATLSLVEELRKNNSKYLYGLFKVEGESVVPDSIFPENDNDSKEVANDKKSGDSAFAEAFKTKHWKRFLGAVENAAGPRFGVTDFAYTTSEGRVVRNLVCVSYCPDKGTPARVKMTFASTKTSFEAKINVGKKYQANDISDLVFDTVLEYIKTH